MFIIIYLLMTGRVTTGRVYYYFIINDWPGLLLLAVLFIINDWPGLVLLAVLIINDWPGLLLLSVLLMTDWFITTGRVINDWPC